MKQTVRDFATQSGYSIYDPKTLLDFTSDITITDTKTAATFRATGNGDVIALGGNEWGHFQQLLELPIVWVTYDSRKHHVYLEVDG